MGWLETKLGALGQMVRINERRHQHQLALERIERRKIMT